MLDVVWFLFKVVAALAAAVVIYVIGARSIGNFSKSDPAHLSYKELMANRGKLDCGRIILTHLGRETQAHLAELELEPANDGMQVTL